MAETKKKAWRGDPAIKRRDGLDRYQDWFGVEDSRTGEVIVWKWTAERVVRALQRWTRERGRAPRTVDADRIGSPPIKRGFGLEQVKVNGLPSQKTVRKFFGTWSAGLDAAEIPQALRKKRRAWTHCRRGHRLSGANLRIKKGTGYRQCRACDALRARQRRREARANG